jgi:Domain of unknown function (DUF6378)
VSHALTDDDLCQAEYAARKFSGCWWTGTSGTLASWLLLAVQEIRSTRSMKAPDDTPTNAAEHLLRTAIHTVGARRATYGPPREHFARTVAAINAIFSHKLLSPLTEADWAQIMILDKLARHQGTSKSSDTPVDCAGYAACLAECEQG